MMHPRNTAHRLSSMSWFELSTSTARDNEDLSGLQPSAGDQPEFSELPNAQQTLLASPTSPPRTAKHGRPEKRCSFAISRPVVLILLCLLLPSAVLLALIMYYRVESGRSLFANAEKAMNKHTVYVNISA